jgi:hypothetical protein
MTGYIISIVILLAAILIMSGMPGISPSNLIGPIVLMGSYIIIVIAVLIVRNRE